MLSVIIPAYNERENVTPTVEGLIAVLRREALPFEIVVVNDNSKDDTRQVVLDLIRTHPEVVLVDNTPPGGFGRAIRMGLRHFAGDAVAIVMADGSDDPEDLVRCYRKLLEGYDCVFGSRFRRDSRVIDYPPLKLFVNRVVNKFMQLMFLTPYNDLTNAFKVYRRSAIEGMGELESCHFNITIELSLSCVIRKYRIVEVPISWYGRKWGASNLKLSQMGRRYLATLLMVWFEGLLVSDDMMLETQGRSTGRAPVRRIEHGSQELAARDASPDASQGACMGERNV